LACSAMMVLAEVMAHVRIQGEKTSEATEIGPM
jgi:hypothetical protein